MLFSVLEKHVISRIRNEGQQQIMIPDKVQNDLKYNNYDSLMDMFNGYNFIRGYCNACKKDKKVKKITKSNHILEIHVCKKCKTTIHHRKYKFSNALSKHKKGRCGEFTQVCYHILKQNNKRVFFVGATFDHAWCIVENNGKFISIDPSDKTINKWSYTTPDMRQTQIYAWSSDTSQPINISNMYSITKA